MEPLAAGGCLGTGIVAAPECYALSRTCYLCGGRHAVEVDHVKVGDDHPDANLRGICRPCHRVKSARKGRAARGPLPTERRPGESDPGLLG
jgi:hypothetical protein